MITIGFFGVLLIGIAILFMISFIEHYVDCGVWKVQTSQEISDAWYISNRYPKRKILEQIKKCEYVKIFTTQEK